VGVKVVSRRCGGGVGSLVEVRFDRLQWTSAVEGGGGGRWWKILIRLEEASLRHMVGLAWF